LSYAKKKRGEKTRRRTHDDVVSSNLLLGLGLLSSVVDENTESRLPGVVDVDGLGFDLVSPLREKSERAVWERKRRGSAFESLLGRKRRVFFFTHAMMRLDFFLGSSDWFMTMRASWKVERRTKGREVSFARRKL